MKKDRGFVGLIIILIVALAALKYFLNWSIFDAVSTEQGKSTILYIRDVVNIVWHYLSVPVQFIWDKMQILLKK